jgi:hypothetical protein
VVNYYEYDGWVKPLLVVQSTPQQHCYTQEEPINFVTHRNIS